MARRRVCFYRQGISCHGHRVLHSVVPERSANVAEFLESETLDQNPIYRFLFLRYESPSQFIIIGVLDLSPWPLRNLARRSIEMKEKFFRSARIILTVVVMIVAASSKL